MFPPVYQIWLICCKFWIPDSTVYFEADGNPDPDPDPTLKLGQINNCNCLTFSVMDPDPDPFSQRYGSGSFPFFINVLSGLI
jgi:hypothetical protein